MFVRLYAEGHYIKKWTLPGMPVVFAVKTNFQSLRGKSGHCPSQKYLKGLMKFGGSQWY